MGVQITSVHVHLQFIISSDSEPVACVTELAHRVVVNSRETKPRGLPASPACQVGSGSKGLGGICRKSTARRGMRGDSEAKWHKKLKNKTKHNMILYKSYKLRL